VANTDKTDSKKKKMIVSLESSLGVVTLACKKAGVSRTQHYFWLSNDEEYKRAVDDISEISVDFVESKLYENIKTGDTTSIIFFLKTKGRKRGYSEHQLIQLSGEVKAGIKIDEWIEKRFN
jgi:hypothetical protein